MSSDEGPSLSSFVEFDLRWFTPSGASGSLRPPPSPRRMPSGRPARPAIDRFFYTRSGPLPVMPLGDGLAELDFPSAPPCSSLIPDEERANVTPEKVAEALQLHPSSSAGPLPLPSIVGRNAVGDTFAVFSDPRHVLDASPVSEAIAALGGRGLVITAAGGVGENGVAVDFTSRFFGPNIGIPEDPVTGSSFCGLAPYWAQTLGEKQQLPSAT